MSINNGPHCLWFQVQRTVKCILHLAITTEFSITASLGQDNNCQIGDDHLQPAAVACKLHATHESPTRPRLAIHPSRKRLTNSRSNTFHARNVCDGLRKNESTNISDDCRFHPRSICFDFESTAEEPDVEVERLIPAAPGNKRSAPPSATANPG